MVRGMWRVRGDVTCFGLHTPGTYCSYTLLVFAHCYLTTKGSLPQISPRESLMVPLGGVNDICIRMLVIPINGSCTEEDGCFSRIPSSTAHSDDFVPSSRRGAQDMNLQFHVRAMHLVAVM